MPRARSLSISAGSSSRAASVNPPGRTAEVADIVRNYLGSRQIAIETVKADDEAPNVVGRVDGGGSGGRHIVFNAHMDTMEAGDESAWTVPIMRLTRRDGRLYGLGMGNMKGALAAMCLATVVLNRHRAAWNGRLSMTAVSDEVMFGERGTVFLLDQRPDLAGDYMISGEGPGTMGFAVAEKGLLWLDIEARSPGGHASRALHGETAVMKLAGLLARIDPMNDMYATVPPELERRDRRRRQSRPAPLAQCRHDRGRYGAQPGGDAGARAARPAAAARHHREGLRGHDPRAMRRRPGHHRLRGQVLGRELDGAR